DSQAAPSKTVRRTVLARLRPGRAVLISPSLATTKNLRRDTAKVLCWWELVDSNHRSIKQQIYSLSPLATRESSHILFVHPAFECLIIIANNGAKCNPFFAFF